MAKHPDRREFIKAGLVTSAAVLTGSAAELIAPRESYSQAVPDVVVSHGMNPAQNARKAIDALGGMKRFVKQGDRVLIKPNMSFARRPEEACTTNPEVVREVALMCTEAGASRVSVLDFVLNNPTDCLKLSGIPARCSDLPDTVVNHVKSERLFREVPVPNGTQLKTMKALSEAVDADVLIAVPVGKSHSSAGVSFSMKGMMGLIWDRMAFHSRFDLHEAIADMVTVLKPHLVVIDGTRILSSGGPGGPGQVIPLNLVVASTDMVAADAQMLTLGTWYGKKFRPDQVRHIRIAAQRGLGRADIEKLQVQTIRT
jgi:uncharacterized protein (DUF362 family)